MTVKELIAVLKKLDPQLNVYASRGDGDDPREVVNAHVDFDIACNDMRCHFVHVKLGETA